MKPAATTLEQSLQRATPIGFPRIANGFLAARFDRLGFQHRAQADAVERTVVDCADHGPLPLLHIRAHVADATPLDRAEDCREHRQELDLLTATLTSAYDLFGPTRIAAYAPRQIPNLLVLRVERRPEGAGKVLHFEVEAETSSCAGGDARPVDLAFDARADGSVAVLSRVGAATTRWVVRCPGAKLEVRGRHVHVRFDVDADGWARHTLTVWVQRDGCSGEEVLARTHDELHAAHVAAWRGWWEGAWTSAGARRAEAGWADEAYRVGCASPP